MKRKKLIRILGTMLIVLIIAAGALGYVTYDHAMKLWQDPSKGLNTSDIDYKIEVTPAPGTTGQPNIKTYADKIVNIAIVGVDSDTERASQGMGYCADSLMFLSINLETGKVTIISIPRDTRALVEHLDKNGKLKKTSFTKINASYSYAADAPMKTRIENVRKSIAWVLSDIMDDENFRVPIDYYIGLDMDGFDSIVNSIGGVDVKLEMDVERIGKKGETKHLTGTDAQHFVRVRKSLPQSDISRARNQQLFLVAVAKKVKSMGPVDVAMRLYDEFVHYVTTNLNYDEILALAGALINVDLENINHMVLPGKSDSNELWIVDKKEAKPILIEALFQ